MNQFAIGYMIKPTLNVNKVFREQVENFLRAAFHQNTTEGIRFFMRKKDTYFIVLIMFYETKTDNPIKVYMVLSFVLYSVIDNNVCIDHKCCHS